MLSEDRAATLIDVRTMAEWSYVGVPDIATLGIQHDRNVGVALIQVIADRLQLIFSG